MASEGASRGEVADDGDRARHPMRRRLRLARLRLLRRIPRKRHLRDTFVHRAFGERVFDPRIWSVTRAGVAGGLAAGILISFTPLIGAHMVLAVVVSYVFRLNLPAALMGAWFMNPATAPILLPLVYKLGKWLDLTPEVQLGTGYAATFRRQLHWLAELTLGGFLMGTVTALAAYAGVTAAWGPLSRLVSGPHSPGARRRRRREARTPHPIDELVPATHPEPGASAPPASPDRTRSTH